MGAPVSFAGVFGGDSHGRMLRDTMHQAGVDTSLSNVSAGPNGQAIIILEPAGDNTIILVPGANNDWDVTLPPGLFEAIEGAACVMLQREIPERINIAVAQHAKKSGVDVLMDVGGDDSPLPNELLECITMCAPNETELQVTFKSWRDIIAMQEGFARQGGGWVGWWWWGGLNQLRGIRL